MAASRLLAMLFFAAGAASAVSAAQREIKRSFAVQPGCTLKIDSYHALLTIEESEAAEIRVSVSIDAEADTEAAAQRLRDGVQLDFKADANTVAIHATNPRETGLRLDVGEPDRVDLIYRISVPRQCSVSLAANTGNFTVGNLQGRMNARLKRGTIFFRRVEGSVDAHTDLGDVVVSRCSGAVTARVLRGVIRLGTIGGVVDVKNSTGDIEVLTAKSGVSAVAEAGDVTVGFGPRIAADARIVVSGGNIFAKIHADASCRIEASSTWGTVQSTLPLTIESGGVGRRRLSGTLNAGGPVVSLRASGGSVKLSSDVVWFDEN